MQPLQFVPSSAARAHCPVKSMGCSRLDIAMGGARQLLDGAPSKKNGNNERRPTVDEPEKSAQDPNKTLSLNDQICL